jgi:transposase
MTKRIPTPANAVLVAIDMSKHRQEVLIERPEGGRRRRMTVMATKADYDRLADYLSATGRPIVVGFEATGNYHRTLAHRLLTSGFELRLISSVALARTREALHNGWDKNDSKDAQVILHMLQIGATQRHVDPLAAGINDLQEMSKTHEAISKAKTQTWHRILTHYLPLYFPEIERCAGNSRSDWFLALLERFSTPGSMTAIGKEAFTSEAWTLVGRKVSKARLINDIYQTACGSMALPVEEDSVAISMFRMVIVQARSLIH